MHGVVLYSGRWRPNIDSMILNHRRYLVDPHHLDVVVVGIRSQICQMRNFEASVRAAWGLSNRRLLVSQQSDAGAKIQFSHVRFAFQKALDWKKHDIFIRARIDRTFTSTVRLPVVHRQVFAVVSDNGWSQQRNLKITRDWFYITNEDGMRVLTNTKEKMIDFSRRCFAACPEEQVELHVKQSNYTIVPINISLVTVSKANWCQHSS